MEFEANQLQINTLQKGMKLTVYIEQEDREEVLSKIHNFIDRPLKVSINIDSEERQKELSQISAKQRKKIYAIFNDIDNFTGQGTDSIKEEMKKFFLQSESNEWGEQFSLGDCPKDLATEFIEFLIDFCFQNGIQLSDHPGEAFDNIKSYIKISLKNKVCAVCGRPGEVHHWDALGAGRNRKTVDDSENRKICLCREHHSECHQIGRETFAEKYHVKGVIWNH